MGWCDDDFELTDELRERGYAVDVEAVSAVRLDAGIGFPVGDDGLEKIVALLNVRKVQRRPSPSPAEVAEFKRKLASTEWQQLVAAARKHLGIPVEPEHLESQKALCGLLAGGIDMLFQAHKVAAGEESNFDYQSAAVVWAAWVEGQRVAASLACYLGTTATSDISGLLLGIYPLQPERLAPARGRTALDEFQTQLFGLVGIPSKESLASQSFRDRALCGAVQIWRGRFRFDWEHTRVLWNRRYPAWVYDSTEAFRKAFERALTRQPPSETD